MKSDFVEVEGLDTEVAWDGIDLDSWRNRPDPEYSELENDEDHPTPKDVVSVLGFDPDEEGWDDEDDGPGGEKVFCPTGAGGGIDATCSPGKAGGYAAPKKNSFGYVPGTVGAFSGVDTSSWKADHPVSQKILKKIAVLEQAAAWGNWGDFTKNMSGASPESSSSKLLKTLLTAQKNLLEKKNQKINSLPAGAEPAKPAPTADLTQFWESFPEKPLVSDGADWKKIGPQLGTEKGGTYEMGGKKYYVKTPDDEGRAKNEVLTNKLYQMAGAGTRESHLVQIDGKLAVASEWVETNGTGKIDFNNKKNLPTLQEDYAAHVWLNNRDAIGAGTENPEMNIIEDKDGNFKIIDVGGGLDYKGMGGGGKKDFNYDASPEWNKMVDSDINPTMAKVFGGMTDQQKVDSISKLDHIGGAELQALVEGMGVDPKIGFRLRGRLDSLRSIRDHIQQTMTIPAAIAPVVPGPDQHKLKVSELPAKPEFLSTNPVFLAENEALILKVKTAAIAGDLATVESLAYGTPSPKTTAYIKAVESAMKAKAYDPAPVKATAKKTLSSINDKMASLAGLTGTLKIGHYKVLGVLPEHEIKAATVAPKKVLAGWKAGKDYIQSLDGETRSAIVSYTGGSYSSMNDSLRSDKPSEKALKVANALMKAPLLKPGMALTRKHGMHSAGGSINDLASLSPGSVITEKGILSTSTKTGVWGGDVQLNITVGKGVKGLPVKSHSQSPHEFEVMLPAGTKFLIKKITKSQYGGSVTLDVMALPTSDDQCCPP